MKDENELIISEIYGSLYHMGFHTNAIGIINKSNKIYIDGIDGLRNFSFYTNNYKREYLDLVHEKAKKLFNVVNPIKHLGQSMIGFDIPVGYLTIDEWIEKIEIISKDYDDLK